VGSWGPAIVGHAHPEVSEALKEQIYKARARPPADASRARPRRLCFFGPAYPVRRLAAGWDGPLSDAATAAEHGRLFGRPSSACPPRPRPRRPAGAACGPASPRLSVQRRAQGTSFGAPCALENVLAKMVIERVPSVEMVRFVNSGTEACLSVLRLMRAHTKRDKARCPARRARSPCHCPLTPAPARTLVRACLCTRMRHNMQRPRTRRHHLAAIAASAAGARRGRPAAVLHAPGSRWAPPSRHARTLLPAAAGALTRRMRARARQVLKFVGCYHGHADSFLVQAGSGVATLGLPDSPGVPASSTGARPRLRRPPASPASARQAPGILPSLVVTRAGGLHSLVVTRARTRVEQGKPQVTRTSSQRECRAGALLPPRLGCTVRAGCGWAPRACEDGGRRRCAASERASCTITALSPADAASLGVRAATTLTATYNDLEGVRKVFEANKGEIAGVILEPVVGNSGFIAPTQEFLQARALASRAPAHAPAHARLASCRARGWRACLRRALVREHGPSGHTVSHPARLPCMWAQSRLLGSRTARPPAPGARARRERRRAAGAARRACATCARRTARCCASTRS